MSLALHNFLKLINLKKIEERLFQGQSEDLGLNRVFGGQVISQAIYAARQTVPHERSIHSFHSYFLRPGDSHKPILYDVELLRDGNSFSARYIRAMQNDKIIFYMTASFQNNETGIEHQYSVMPQTIPPEGLQSENELSFAISDTKEKKIYEKLTNNQPVEIRPVKFHNPFQGQTEKPVQCVWIRANGTMPDEQYIHQCLLGYASDFHFLPTTLQPHGIGFLQQGVQIATIDHSMWFHRSFNLDDWLLYAVESTSAGGSRGFVRGQIYNQAGVLIASTIQEGVIRLTS